MAVEGGVFVHVRRADELAVVGIGPGVVRALQGVGELPGRGGAEARTAVAADVVEGAAHAVAAMQEDDALAAEVEEGVLAWLGDLLDPAGAEPMGVEDVVQLLLVDGGVGVVPAGEGHDGIC